MKLTRKARLTTGLVTLITMLCLQFAEAAHACSGLGTQSSAALKLAMQDYQGGISSGDQPDMDQSVPCLTHCRDGKQSLNKADAPTPSPVFAVSFILMAVDSYLIQLLPAAGQNVSLTRATAPPLSIRNCCFRI